jgi:hypothetical protein
MQQSLPVERPTVARSVGSAASNRLDPRRHEALTVTEAVDTTAVVVGAASAAAAAAVVWWRARHSHRGLPGYRSTVGHRSR